MKKRIITAAVLVPLLLLILFVAPKIVTAVALSILCAVAAVELLYNTGLVRHFRLVAYTAAAAAVVPLWCYFGMDQSWCLAGLLLYFSLLFVEIMVSDMKLRFEKVSVCTVGAFMIPILLSSLVRIMVTQIGRYVIIVPFVVAFLSDSGAYFIGCRFGKHKLAPVISPNKTVEGLAGGMLFSVVGMLLYAAVMQFVFHFQVSYGYALAYGFFGSVLGVFGDLCFSVIKRQTGIKDYGMIFPGHGGVLDRFDSLLLVSPLIELLLLILPVVVSV